MTKRLSTGIDELDEILDGGLLRHSMNILMGSPGTGKTILAEQIAFFHAAQGEKILCLTCDNLVGLRFDPARGMSRRVRILKARNIAHDHGEWHLRIASDGVRIDGDGESPGQS